VHHLPGIRQLVLGYLQGHPQTRLRLTAPALGHTSSFKRHVIEATGGRALARAPQAQAQALNHSLLGIYSFQVTDYRSLMQHWLTQAPASGGLLMCHPGKGTEPGDAIGPARLREWHYLASRDFADDLAAAGVELHFVN
jgi:chitin disaccharide deacetylase